MDNITVANAEKRLARTTAVINFLAALLALLVIMYPIFFSESAPEAPKVPDGIVISFDITFKIENITISNPLRKVPEYLKNGEGTVA